MPNLVDFLEMPLGCQLSAPQWASLSQTAQFNDAIQIEMHYIASIRQEGYYIESAKNFRSVLQYCKASQ